MNIREIIKDCTLNIISNIAVGIGLFFTLGCVRSARQSNERMLPIIGILLGLCMFGLGMQMKKILEFRRRESERRYRQQLRDELTSVNFITKNQAAYDSIQDPKPSVPDEFNDKIIYQLMDNPVDVITILTNANNQSTKVCHTFEKEVINRWMLRSHQAINPMNAQPIREIISNERLRNSITVWINGLKRQQARHTNSDAPLNNRVALLPKP